MAMPCELFPGVRVQSSFRRKEQNQVQLEDVEVAAAVAERVA